VTRTETGFTIVELVFVLVLIGILAVSASSLFFNTSTYNQQVYFSQVLNSLRYAQKLAIATGCNIRVSNSPANAITVDMQLTGSSCTTGSTYVSITDPVSKISPYQKVAPTGVTIVPSNNWPFYFDANGQAHETSDGAIVNLSVTVNGMPINIVGETGFVNDPNS